MRLEDDDSPAYWEYFWCVVMLRFMTVILSFLHLSVEIGEFNIFLSGFEGYLFCLHY